MHISTIKGIFLFGVALFISTQIAAQSLINNTRILDKFIKTVEVHNPNDTFAPALLTLNNNQSQLNVSFDDLRGSIQRYAYTAILCNSDWTSSRLWPNEYFSGLTEERINDSKSSFSTRLAYTHYTFQFPGTSMKLTRSGNYLLKVYEDGRPENVLFTYRIYVMEPLASINGNVKKSSSVEERDKTQEVDFKVTSSNYLIDPRSSIKANIIQNGREDNAIIGLKPKQVVGSELDFDYDTGENTFAAGNEFRRFNTSSVRNAMDHVSGIVVTGDTCNALLLPDKTTAFGSYISEKDINGNFVPHTIDYQNTDTEAEYVKVKFFLGLTMPIAKGQIVISGRFNHGVDLTPGSEFVMKYNTGLRGYVGEGLLKQGYYDYQYLYYPEPQKPGLTSLAEGDFSETQNEYQIFVYYHKPGEIYDRLIGVGIINKTTGN
jgi:hypothetical protein